MSFALALLQLTAFYALCVVSLPPVLPPTTTQPPGTAEPTTTDYLRQLYDYEKEQKIGYFTGPWVPNTLTCFDRVEGVVRQCFSDRIARFHGFLDETDEDYSEPIFDLTDYCYKYRTYLRDFRKNNSVPLSDPSTIFFRSGDVHPEQSEDSYPLNKDAVWQIEVPEDFIAFVLLTSISLEKAASGSCEGDFVSIYADNEIPDKFCSSLDQIRLYKPNSRRITIRFQSNHEINSGKFAGTVYVVPASILDPSSSPSTRKRSAEGKFEFLDKIGREAGVEKFLMDDTINCLSHIAKYGELAANYYNDNESSAECRKIAETFLRNGYTHP